MSNMISAYRVCFSTVHQEQERHYLQELLLAILMPTFSRLHSLSLLNLWRYFLYWNCCIHFYWCCISLYRLYQVLSSTNILVKVQGWFGKCLTMPGTIRWLWFIIFRKLKPDLHGPKKFKNIIRPSLDLDFAYNTQFAWIIDLSWGINHLTRQKKWCR